MVTAKIEKMEKNEISKALKKKLVQNGLGFIKVRGEKGTDWEWIDIDAGRELTDFEKEKFKHLFGIELHRNSSWVASDVNNIRVIQNQKMEKQFLGSAMERETEIDQMEREAQWKKDHTCSLCGSFECDGNHEDTWYDYAEKSGILEGEGLK